jgi:hypothetical protein
MSFDFQHLKSRLMSYLEAEETPLFGEVSLFLTLLFGFIAIFFLDPLDQQHLTTITWPKDTFVSVIGYFLPTQIETNYYFFLLSIGLYIFLDYFGCLKNGFHGLLG